MQILLLTFANNRSEPLETLTEEYLDLNRTLTPRAFKQHYLMHPLSHATREEVAYYLTLFREQLSLFLYSGHADREEWIRVLSNIGFTIVTNSTGIGKIIRI